jgi:hypothetical protein
MTQTTFTITDADVGTTIGPPDGFVTDLAMTQPPPVYEVPEWDEGRQVWTAGYFILRGSGDHRDTDPVNGRYASESGLRLGGSVATNRALNHVN